VVDFEAGPVASLITSFDVYSHNLPRIEIYGSEGSMTVPDPNTFGGPVRVRKPRTDYWMDMDLTHSSQVGRGIGVADLAYALLCGRPQRASGGLAYHVLDVMMSLHEASASGQHMALASTVACPAPLPVGLAAGVLDE